MILTGGRSLNGETVRAGLAQWYRQRAPYDRDLERLEAETRAARPRLWAEAVRVSPWEWRKKREAGT